jgi:hypothetical protein
MYILIVITLFMLAELEEENGCHLQRNKESFFFQVSTSLTVR